jgi:hypothetical protein
MGRDMAVIADLFEAFYTSIGQHDRVIRLGMSTATLDSMTQETTLEFLKSSGINLDGKIPYLLVDAVSRGGGRQGRALINAVYSNANGDDKSLAKRFFDSVFSDSSKDTNKGSKSIGDLLYYFNMIGLRVFTTKIPDIPIQKAQAQLALDAEALEKEIKKGHVDFGKRHNILSFTDARSMDFLGINEAGYTHWTGAWHGSYGAIEKSAGRVFARPGQVSDLAMRQAIVGFQAAIVDLASSPDFRARVEEAAKKIGYHFPLNRPTYVARPMTALYDGVMAAQSFAEIIERESEFDRTNLGRIDQRKKLLTLKTALMKRLSVLSPKLQLTSEEAISLHQRVRGGEIDTKFDVELISAVPGANEKAKTAAALAKGFDAQLYAQFIGPVHTMIVNDAKAEGEASMLSIFSDLLDSQNVDMALKAIMIDELFKLASSPVDRLSVAEKYLPRLSEAAAAKFIDQNFNELFVEVGSGDALKEAVLKVLEATHAVRASDATRVKLADLFLMQAKSVEEFFDSLDRISDLGFVGEHREQAITRQLLTFVALKPVAADVNRLARMISKENKELKELVFMRSLDALKGREQLDALELPGGVFSRGKGLKARIEEFKKNNPAGTPSWMFWARKAKSCSGALTGK